MRCLCLLLCVLALFSSCKESEKDKIARLVEEWEGKEILFPARSVFTIQGKDTVNFSFVDADYKVVTYIDSVGCTSCKLQLPRWKQFMQEVDSTLNRPVPFAFYFHPKDMKELRYITCRDVFTYPVCFDEMDDFNRLNHFPGEMTFQTFLLDKDNKVVTYIDSVGCTSCKLQLPRWKQFMQEVDSTLNRPVPFAFYFHPKDMKELRYITCRDVFTYPVCFDEMDDFNRLNHFPGEMTFQTFLLDKDNKVVAIGNPVHNPKVKELYLKVLTGGEVVKAETPITKVIQDVESIDFGSFPQLEKQERKFTLTNTGQHVLVIYDVITSCGCTRVNYSKEGIRPGEKAVLTVIYEAEKAEHFSKTVTIYCNADNSPLRLKITGNAE